MPREAHIWCISLPALHLYDLKLPNFTLTSTTYETDDDFLFSFSFVQFVELENIYYEFTSKRVRLHLTEASSSPIFFSVFEKKNTGVHVAYSNRFRPSPLSQSRRRFRFPLIKTLKRWKYDSMIASLTRHTLYDEWDHRIYDLRFRPSTQNYKPACSKKITILTYTIISAPCNTIVCF